MIRSRKRRTKEIVLTEWTRPPRATENRNQSKGMTPHACVHAHVQLITCGAHRQNTGPRPRPLPPEQKRRRHTRHQQLHRQRQRQRQQEMAARWRSSGSWSRSPPSSTSRTRPSAPMVPCAHACAHITHTHIINELDDMIAPPPHPQPPHRFYAFSLCCASRIQRAAAESSGKVFCTKAGKCSLLCAFVRTY